MLSSRPFALFICSLPGTRLLFDSGRRWVGAWPALRGSSSGGGGSSRGHSGYSFGRNNRKLTPMRASGVWLAGDGPLQRTIQQPGFPDCIPVDPQLCKSGGCLHIPGLGSPHSDRTVAKELLAEIKALGDGVVSMHRSKRHLQVFGEKITGSDTFTAIVSRLLSVFDMSLVDCWVNVYRNGGESKAWHKDNYWDRWPRPTVTIGLSLGEPRELMFKDESGRIVRVMQNNGDVFAFDEPFNRYWAHAIPPDDKKRSGCRLSVILWATENQGVAVPAMTRSGSGMDGREVRWDQWDLEAGLFSSSKALQQSR